jgi:hypothetical protein
VRPQNRQPCRVINLAWWPPSSLVLYACHTSDISAVFLIPETHFYGLDVRFTGLTGLPAWQSSHLLPPPGHRIRYPPPRLHVLAGTGSICLPADLQRLHRQSHRPDAAWHPKVPSGLSPRSLSSLWRVNKPKNALCPGVGRRHQTLESGKSRGCSCRIQELEEKG